MTTVLFHLAVRDVTMRLMWKAVDKMRCLRKRSVFPFLGFLVTFLLFFNLYLDDGYVLVGLFGFEVYHQILVLSSRLHASLLLNRFLCF